MSSVHLYSKIFIFSTKQDSFSWKTALSPLNIHKRINRQFQINGASEKHAELFTRFQSREGANVNMVHFQKVHHHDIKIDKVLLIIYCIKKCGVKFYSFVVTMIRKEKAASCHETQRVSQKSLRTHQCRCQINTWCWTQDPVGQHQQAPCSSSFKVKPYL